ncbi:MAG: hypothetical protein EBR28_12710 [Planctomycetia bacterium]|nr:hypothetical protein [Planctomycetia bacterium]
MPAHPKTTELLSSNCGSVCSVTPIFFTASASAFAASGKQVCQAIDAHGASGRLNVEIAGKVYVGKVSGHTHDHKH